MVFSRSIAARNPRRPGDHRAAAAARQCASPARARLSDQAVVTDAAEGHGDLAFVADFLRGGR